MPIYKYKSFEEAEQALWNFHPDETYFRKVADLWHLANKFLPFSYPKGIFKFQSMEEATGIGKSWSSSMPKRYRPKGNSILDMI